MTDLEVKNIIDLFRINYNSIICEGFIDLDIDIQNIDVIGSRRNGTNRADSDLDIKLEYIGDIREDDLFNVLHDEEIMDMLSIDGLVVDVFPVKL